MAADKSELERLRRIRQQQLAARDPSKKQNKLQKTITHKHRSRSQSFSIGTMWTEVPSRWKGAFFGSLFGVIAIFVLPLVTDAEWATTVGFVLLFFMAVMGFLVGRSKDAQDDLRKLVR
jgi:VIT1/CCC1 family predicted Fe2+/Mn2+ transporter